MSPRVDPLSVRWPSLDPHPTGRARLRQLRAWRRTGQPAATLGGGDGAPPVSPAEVDWDQVPLEYHTAAASGPSGPDIPASQRGSVAVRVERELLERWDNLCRRAGEERGEVLRRALSVLERELVTGEE